MEARPRPELASALEVFDRPSADADGRKPAAEYDCVATPIESRRDLAHSSGEMKTRAAHAVEDPDRVRMLSNRPTSAISR